MNVKFIYTWSLFWCFWLIVLGSDVLVSYFSPQLYGELQQVKAEISDLQEEYITQRQQHEQTQEDLMRDLKFKFV